MARVVVVLDDLFGLPVTLGGVGVLDGREFAPGDALGRPHQPQDAEDIWLVTKNTHKPLQMYN